MLKKDFKQWHSIIESIELTLPYYEFGSNLVGFGMPKLLRYLMVKYIDYNDCLIIDVGTGTGAVINEIMRHRNNHSYIIGLDISLILIKTAKKRLNHLEEYVDFIYGLAEYIPVRSSSINVVCTSFSFRDVLSYRISLSEFLRVLIKNGKWICVDMGKPNNKALTTIGYYLIILASSTLGGLVSLLLGRNPWKKLVETYQRNPRNRNLVAVTSKMFNKVLFKTILFGLAYLLVATK